jgi:hypothetical protein
MNFEDVIELLKLEINNVKNRKGYVVVSIHRKDRKDIYDSRTIDSLFMNLGTDNKKPDYICSYSLYIENNVPLRLSIEFKKENDKYRCDIKKDI